MADGTLPNGEHLPGNEQVPQVPQQPKQSLDQSIAEGRLDYLREALASEADSAKKEAAQLSQAARTEGDPEAEATNQEVAALDAEAEKKIADAKTQAEQELEQVVKPVEVPVTEQAGVMESLEGDSVKTKTVEATVESKPPEPPVEKAKPADIPSEAKKEQSQAPEKPKMPDLNPHFEAAQRLMSDFKQNNFQAGPIELRKLVKLMTAVHPDLYPGVPAVAAFSGLLGRLKMAFAGDQAAWNEYETDFQKLKQDIQAEAGIASGVETQQQSEQAPPQEPKVESQPSSEPQPEAPPAAKKESYPSPEQQLQSLEKSAESAKQRMRELYEGLMKMKESGGELDQEELAEYIRALDEDAVLNAFVNNMQAEFRNTKNTEATRARAAQLADEFARGARAQVAYAEGIVTPKSKPAEAASKAEAPKPREVSEAEKKQHALEKQVFGRLRKMDALVDQLVSGKGLSDADRVALRDQLENLQQENVKDWDELSQAEGGKNEALFDMQQRMTDTLHTVDQLLAENDPGAKAILEKQVQGFREASALEEPGLNGYFSARDAEFGTSAEKPKASVEEVDERAETERRMNVMEELLTAKIRKVEEAYDEVLESGDETKIEACTNLLSRLYTERMAGLTKDINAYYRKKPSERSARSEKQVGIWLYEEELLGAQMDANLKKREVVGLKREKQVVDKEVDDLQALIDRSIPTGPNLQLAGAPAKVGGLGLPEASAGLALASAAKAEVKTDAPEELAKKMQALVGRQAELAAKIGLAAIALGEMYRQMDRIVKARAKDLEELDKLNKPVEAFLMAGVAANDNADMSNHDAKVSDAEFKVSGSGEGRGSGGQQEGMNWFERAGDAVFMAMHGDEQSITVATKLFDDIKSKVTGTSKKAA